MNKKNKNRGLIVLAVILLIGLGVYYFVIRKKQGKKYSKNLEIRPTWDKYTNERMMTLHPFIRGSVSQAINELESKYGIEVRVTSDGAYRSNQEQLDLYNIYLGGGPLAAPPGKSYHNYGLAIDAVEIKGPVALWEYPNGEKMAEIFKKYGFDWGFHLWGKDKPHFQKTFGFTTTQLKNKIAANEIILDGSTKYANV